MNGGFAADCPINWGWRASGGISFLGVTMGILSMMDILAEKKLRKTKFIKDIINKTEIPGLHIFTHEEKWIKEYISTFVIDSILSIKDLNIFNWGRVEKVLKNYFKESNYNYHGTICYLLDLSVARTTFKIH